MIRCICFRMQVYIDDHIFLKRYRWYFNRDLIVPYDVWQNRIIFWRIKPIGKLVYNVILSIIFLICVFRVYYCMSLMLVNSSIFWRARKGNEPVVNFHLGYLSELMDEWLRCWDIYTLYFPWYTRIYNMWKKRINMTIIDCEHCKYIVK